MQCDKYREQLELLPNCEAEEFVEVKQHVKGCSICKENFFIIKELDLSIQQEMNAITIPPYLVDKIKKQIGLTAKRKSVIAQLKMLAVHSVENHQQVISCQLTELTLGFTLSKPQHPLFNLSCGLELIGGGNRKLCENNADFLVYSHEKEKVSICVLCANDLNLTNWDGRLKVLNQKDFNVAIWKDKDFIYSMVLRAPVEEIASIIDNLYTM